MLAHGLAWAACKRNIPPMGPDLNKLEVRSSRGCKFLREEAEPYPEAYRHSRAQKGEARALVSSNKLNAFYECPDRIIQHKASTSPRSYALFSPTSCPSMPNPLRHD